MGDLLKFQVFIQKSGRDPDHAEPHSARRLDTLAAMDNTEQWLPRRRPLRGKTCPEWPGARQWIEAVIEAGSGTESWVWSLALVDVEDLAAVVLMAPDLVSGVLETLRAHSWVVLHDVADDLERQVAWRRAVATQRAIEYIRNSAR